MVSHYYEYVFNLSLMCLRTVCLVMFLCGWCEALNNFDTHTDSRGPVPATANRGFPQFLRCSYRTVGLFSGSQFFLFFFKMSFSILSCSESCFDVKKIKNQTLTLSAHRNSL